MSVARIENDTAVYNEKRRQRNEADVDDDRISTTAVTSVVRVQRRNGRIVSDCDVYIGRRWSLGGWNLPQSKWHNPFTIKQCGSAAAAIKEFEQYLLNEPTLMSALDELKGQRLGCWCKPQVCHGDVLAKYANALAVETHKNKRHIDL